MSMVTHLEELCFIKWNTSPHSFTKPTKDPLWKDVVSPWEESRNWPITAAPSFGFICIPTRLSPWRRKWQPTPVLLPGKSHGQRRQEDYSPWGGKESDTIQQLSTHAPFPGRWARLLTLHLCLQRALGFSGYSYTPAVCELAQSHEILWAYFSGGEHWAPSNRNLIPLCKDHLL